jgi:hypothetical protein
MSTRFVRSNQVLWRRTTNGVVLLPSHETEPFTLSGSGSALWEVLAEPVALDEASQLLAELHGVDADVVANDIAPVLDELTRRSAVERVE